MEVSRTVRAIPTEVPLGKREGLPQRCAANADTVVTIPKIWLEARIAHEPSEKPVPESAVGASRRPGSELPESELVCVVDREGRFQK